LHLILWTKQQKIEQTKCVKDLGIKMSDTLSFTDHIETVCNKVQQKCRWIIRTFHDRDMHTMKTLWCSIVQPHIDYCSQLWTPHKVGDMQKIESIFRSFSCKIYPISELNYWDRLSAIKMYSQKEDGKIQNDIHLENSRRNCPQMLE